MPVRKIVRCYTHAYATNSNTPIAIRQFILLLIYLPALLYCYRTNAQQKINDYFPEQFNTSNGLPNNEILGMQWDDNSQFLWMQTSNGIVRFNGAQFVSFFDEKPNAINLKDNMFMVKNYSGTIYVSDRKKNIASINYNLPAIEYNADETKAVNNHFFAAVSPAFLQSKSNIPAVFSEPFKNIIPTSDTSCLILYQSVLYQYTIHAVQPIPIFSGVKYFFKAAGKLFITSTTHVNYEINPATLTKTTVAFNTDEKALARFNIDSNQLFWNTGMDQPVVIVNNKAFVIDYANGALFTALITKHIPTDDRISGAIYVHKNRMLFVSTFSKGFIVYYPKIATPMKRRNASHDNNNATFSQVELSNGNILTNEGDIIGNNSNAAVEVPIKKKFLTQSFTTANRYLWYNAFSPVDHVICLYRYDYTTHVTKIFNYIQNRAQVIEVNGTTYLTNPDGIGYMKNDSFYITCSYPGKVHTCYAIAEIRPGILGLANTEGLFTYTIATNKLDTIYHKSDVAFTCLWQYKDYTIAGSYGYGLFLLKGNHIKPLPLDKNEYLKFIDCITQDAFGYCWITTNMGLFKVQLNQLTAQYDNDALPLYYHYIGKREGLDMIEFVGGCSPCALTLKNQTISFLNMDGLVWVDPATANPVTPGGAIFIDKIILNDNLQNRITADAIATASLPASASDITIHISYTAWCGKDNIYIDYQLNDTSKWNSLSKDNESALHFSNLKPGSYTVNIRKLNGFDGGYSYKQIRFRISYPWYQTWWFYLCMLLALTMLIRWLIHIRTRQYKISQLKLEQQVQSKTKELIEQNEVLEKNDIIKTRLISIISHDIIAPLKFVTVAGNKMVEKRHLMNDDMQDEIIKEMANTTQELQLLSTNILNWIKYQNENRRLEKENFTVHEVVQNVIGILQSIARQKNILIENHVDPGLEIYQYMEPLKILIYNLLNNAITFSDKENIIVSSTTKIKEVIVSVKDRGTGMSPEQIKNIMGEYFLISSANIDKKKGNGLGYLIIKDLVKTMQASLEIESEVGFGTTVHIKISYE